MTESPHVCFQEECRAWDVNEVVFSAAMWSAFEPLMRADFTLFDQYRFQHTGVLHIETCMPSLCASAQIATGTTGVGSCLRRCVLHAQARSPSASLSPASGGRKIGASLRAW